jgi:glyoxylase-like metal-dependent hydrolase (beta-lactamase superfamily II)
MDAEIEHWFEPHTGTLTYVVSDPSTGAAAIIDPVLDYDPRGGRISTASVDKVLAAVEARGLKLERVLETHAHADHLSAAQTVKRRTGARIGVGARIVEVQQTFAPRFGFANGAVKPSAFDDLWKDGAQIPLGRLKIEVMSTPGHTPACVSYLIGDAAFVGDTLFMPDYGTARCDFPGGDARTLYRSVRRLLSLPPQTRLFTGHDYPDDVGRSEHRACATVAEQRASNRHVADSVSEDAFVEMRSARDAKLAAPALIFPSLQVNIRAGRLPPPERDGRVYLKTPVTGEP